MPGLTPPPLIRADDPRAEFLITQYLQELYRVARTMTFLDADGTVADGRRSLNIDAVWVRYVSNGVANTEDTVNHNLGRIPREMWVGLPDKAAIIYSGPTAWTATQVFLRSNTATTTVNILLF